MKKQIYDEKNGLSYTLHGDYYLPDLEINEEEPTYGKYGIMRKQFLKEHRSARYQYLVLTGKLTEQLNQVDKEAREKVEMLVEQMAEQWGVTEELKMQNQMEWVRKMNNIRSRAVEIIDVELICVYEDKAADIMLKVLARARILVYNTFCLEVYIYETIKMAFSNRPILQNLFG